MPILYAVTFKAMGNLYHQGGLRMNLVANDQVEAVKIASEEAERLKMVVERVEELESVEALRPGLLKPGLRQNEQLPEPI